MCDTQKALVEAAVDVPSIWVHLSIPDHNRQFFNQSFVSHEGILPKDALNVTFWWSFLLRHSVSWKQNSQKIADVCAKYVQSGNPSLSVKGLSTLRVPDCFSKFSWVNRIELLDLKTFSLHRNLGLLEHLVVLRLDGNNLTYVCFASSICFVLNYEFRLGSLVCSTYPYAWMRYRNRNPEDPFCLFCATF